MADRRRGAAPARDSALALEAADEPICCITIVPGSTLTDGGGRTREQRLASGASFLAPEDIADAVLFVLRHPERACAQELVVWPREGRALRAWQSQQAWHDAR